MTITYSEAVHLYILKRMNAERSIYSIFHLFQGKKSSQTIQDAHLFKLTPFFQVFPSIKRTEVKVAIDQLVHKKCLIEITPDHFRLSDEGENLLSHFLLKKQFPPPFLAGWKYHHLTTIFWERLTLLIQVCSNLAHQTKGFLPVQNRVETQQWVKGYLKKQRMNRYQLARCLHDELSSCLEQENHINPSALIIRLTGHNSIGLTTEQAAEKLEMEVMQYQLDFLNTLHYLIENLEDSARYPYLSQLVQSEPLPFTQSTAKTFKWLQKGFSVEKIAHIRNLKVNTIEDHIVEIALHLPDFDINQFVHPKIEEQINDVIQRTSTKKLRKIKEHVAEVDYFQIRLVLARNGEI